jgi:uncharacterized delta-60 repeat protein
LAVQADGKILVGGNFMSLDGQARSYIGRLNADGTLDATFNPGASGTVNSLAVQADGKILVGGFFTMLGGQTRNRIARLNIDGTLDASFNPGASGTVGCMVYSLAVQADGKILVGGEFTTLGGQTRNRIGRLNADGTLDASFNPGASSAIYSLAVQTDGKVLVGGTFTNLGGQARSCIARVNNNGLATETLNYDGATVSWLRSGCGPEVWRTTFEHTTDGVVWTMLGAGNRISGGWQLGGVSVTGGVIRARGYTTGGRYNGSAGIVETGLGSPIIVEQPVSCTNNAGTTATFTVGVIGSIPFSYQWRKDGVGLIDGGNIIGSCTPTLRLLSALPGDAGTYSVVVSNMVSSVISLDALLTVVALDSDGDGVPDWWTSQYFGHPTGQSNDLSRAADDATGTGQNNLFKYVAGLDPTNSASVFRFRIESVFGNPSQQRLVFSPCWNDRTYTPMYCTNLVSGALWTNLITFTTSDNGTERTVTDTNATEKAKFYRIQITYP